MDAEAAQEFASQINAAATRLPPFAANEALTWFRRAETKFRLKNIKNSITKADHVLEALPEEVFRRLAPWLDDQPAELQYEQLKNHLLTEFSLSQSERARRVFAMPNLPLGDRSARDVWHDILTLCRLPITDADGNFNEIDLKKEIWLQTLPDHVRSLLHETDTTPTADLLKKADALVEAHRQSQLRPTFTASMEPIHDDCGDVNSTQPQNDQQRYRQPGYRETRRTTLNAYINQAGYCTYHAKFGIKARKCLEGCKWTSKNANGGRHSGRH